MNRRTLALALLASASSSSTVAQQPREDPAVPMGSAVAVLQPKGVDQVVLETTFRFAQEFNARTPDERGGARIVGVAHSFLLALAPKVYEVRVPADVERARDRLRQGLRGFLEGYVRHLIDQRVLDIELRQSESIEQYLGRASAAKRCNEIPCPQPPCCRDCSAPSAAASPCPL